MFTLNDFLIDPSVLMPAIEKFSDSYKEWFVSTFPNGALSKDEVLHAIQQEVSMVIDMKELTNEEVEVLGIDLSSVEVCRKVRRLANLDRLRLDVSEHYSTLNKHLFSYLDYCDIDKLSFIKEYLKNLQPYMIREKGGQEKKDSFICVIDNMYRVSVYIKVDSTHNEEVVISFHEDNKKGIAKTNHLITLPNPVENVVVFADKCRSYSTATGKATIDIMMQRGLLTLPISVIGAKYKDMFVVRRRDIEAQFLEYCNTYLSDLYTSDLDIDFSQVEVFTSLQQISFTSYGKSTFDTLSLLIDSLCIQRDPVSKKVVDFALIEFCSSLKLSTTDEVKLIDTLNERYRVSSVRAMPDILARINTAIQA